MEYSDRCREIQSCFCCFQVCYGWWSRWWCPRSEWHCEWGIDETHHGSAPSKRKCCPRLARGTQRAAGAGDAARCGRGGTRRAAGAEDAARGGRGGRGPWRARGTLRAAGVGDVARGGRGKRGAQRARGTRRAAGAGDAARGGRGRCSARRETRHAAGAGDAARGGRGRLGARRARGTRRAARREIIQGLAVQRTSWLKKPAVQSLRHQIANESIFHRYFSFLD